MQVEKSLRFRIWRAYKYNFHNTVRQKMESRQYVTVLFIFILDYRKKILLLFKFLFENDHVVRMYNYKFSVLSVNTFFNNDINGN